MQRKKYPNREQVLQEAKGVFFQAMLAGYANVNKAPANGLVREIIGLEGRLKTVVFTTGDYVVVDEWEVTPYSDRSTGTTDIFYKGVRIWRMYYGGFYQEHVTEFLKKTLAVAYRQRSFHGGRGPETHTLGGLTYQNIGEINDFSEFSGREEVKDYMTGRLFGRYDYFGMALI